MFSLYGFNFLKLTVSGFRDEKSQEKARDRKQKLTFS